MNTPNNRASHERIPVAEARQLYEQLGTWRAVADAMRRKDGSRFTVDSIWNAVRRADKGKP